MNSHIKILPIIIIIKCLLKLAKLEEMEIFSEKRIEEVPNEQWEKILTLNEIVRNVESELDKLNDCMNQQAELVYNNKPNALEVLKNRTQQSFTNYSASAQEFFNEFNTKLLALDKTLQDSLTPKANLFVNKTQFIEIIVESFNKCLDDKSSNRANQELLQHLDQQIHRVDLLQEKLENLRKHEENLQASFENLSKILNDVNFAVDSQNQQFEFLEKQLSILQDSSKTLDDFIIRRNEHLNFHHKCRNKNYFGKRI